MRKRETERDRENLFLVITHSFGCLGRPEMKMRRKKKRERNRVARVLERF